MRIRWTVLLLAGLVAAGPARADDDDESVGYATRTLPLDAFRVAEAPRSPVLAAASDAAGHFEEDSETWGWFSDGGRPDDWITFDEPDTDRYALSCDVLRDVLYELNTEPLETYEHHLLEAREHRLYVAGRPGVVQRIEDGFHWAAAGLAPALGVHASIGVKRPEGRLLAEGAGRLFPGRWTRVIFQRNMQPFIVDWGIEIAQESTSMNPVRANLPEGQEVYVRCHPGETVTLVEVWVGSLEHTETRDLDLSVVRNVPEGNAPGPVRYPLTQIQRAHSVMALAAGEAATQTIRFTQDGRETELTLRFDPPAGSHPATTSGGPRRMAILRTLASQGDLDFEVRENGQDEWVERVTSYVWAARSFDDDQYQLSLVPNAAVIFGIPEAIEVARARLESEEALLVPATVSLRLLTLSETRYRTAVEARELSIGRAVSADVLDSLRPSGVEASGGLELPTVIGLMSGFRLGHSVPGLTDLDSEVAQQSAGLSPDTSAMFAGLAGTVRIERRGRGYALSCRGRIAWADPESGRLDLVLRPPLGMGMQHEDYRKEPDARRVASLPILGGGDCVIDVSAELDSIDGTTYLLGAVVRGSEVQVLVGSVRR